MTLCLSMSSKLFSALLLLQISFPKTFAVFALPQICLAWPSTSFRVSAWMSAQRGCSSLKAQKGDGVTCVRHTASSALKQIAASNAAQDTSSEMATASHCIAAQVRYAGTECAGSRSPSIKKKCINNIICNKTIYTSL